MSTLEPTPPAETHTHTHGAKGSYTLENPSGSRVKQATRKSLRHTAHPATARSRSTAAERTAGARAAGAATQQAHGSQKRLGNKEGQTRPPPSGYVGGTCARSGDCAASTAY